MVSTPVLNQGSESPGELDGQENVEELAGSNLLCSGEQLEQLLCGSSRMFEPVSMTTVLIRWVSDGGLFVHWEQF